MQVSPPKVGDTQSLQMMVSNLDYDQHKGRMAIGRVNSGRLIRGQTVAVAKPGEIITKIFHIGHPAPQSSASTRMISFMPF